jgi:hypothetical protein
MNAKPSFNRHRDTSKIHKTEKKLNPRHFFPTEARTNADANLRLNLSASSALSDRPGRRLSALVFPLLSGDNYWGRFIAIVLTTSNTKFQAFLSKQTSFIRYRKQERTAATAIAIATTPILPTVSKRRLQKCLGSDSFSFYCTCYISAPRP